MFVCSFNGLHKKAFTNLQKLSIVYAGARETLESMKAKKHMEKENERIGNVLPLELVPVQDSLGGS